VDCFQGRAAVPSGTVKWFNEARGYGFIKPDNSGRNVFVHVKEIQKAGYSSLVDGAQVEFDIVERRGREAAQNLRVK
jgi:CspA family cold shock protein